MLKKTIGIFMGAMVVTTTMLVAGHAGAWTVRRSGTSCVGGGGNSTWGISGNNTSSTNSIVLGCDILSESDKPHQNITHMNVHVDKSTTTLAIGNRCVKFFNATGGACGNAHSSSSTGTVTLNPPNTPSTFAAHWNGGAHFPSIAITLPALASIKGFYTDNL
jgi:hypothetical protein